MDGDTVHQLSLIFLRWKVAESDHLGTYVVDIGVHFIDILTVRSLYAPFKCQSPKLIQEPPKLPHLAIVPNCMKRVHTKHKNNHHSNILYGTFEHEHKWSQHEEKTYFLIVGQYPQSHYLGRVLFLNLCPLTLCLCLVFELLEEGRRTSLFVLDERLLLEIVVCLAPLYIDNIHFIWH